MHTASHAPEHEFAIDRVTVLQRLEALRKKNAVVCLPWPVPVRGERQHDDALARSGNSLAMAS
jgi:hypothetical protein